MRVVLSGGGTGGHVYPALAVAAALTQELSDKGPLELLYIGVRGRMDEHLVTDEIVSLPRRQGRRPSRPFALGLRPRRRPTSLSARCEARRYLTKFRPHVVFATGGYASVPVAVAARSRQAPAAGLPARRPSRLGRTADGPPRHARSPSPADASLPYLPKGKTVRHRLSRPPRLPRRPPETRRSAVWGSTPPSRRCSSAAAVWALTASTGWSPRTSPGSGAYVN